MPSYFLQKQDGRTSEKKIFTKLSLIINQEKEGLEKRANKSNRMKLFSLAYLATTCLCLLIASGVVCAQVPAKTNQFPAVDTSRPALPINKPNKNPLLPDIPSPEDTTFQPKEKVDSSLTQGGIVVPYSFSNPRKFTVAEVKVTGSNFLDPSLIASVTGIYKGQEVVLPGEDLAEAVKKLWN